MLRKLALLAAVAALALSLAGGASAKEKKPPYGNAYGFGLGVSDGN